jgi:predicted amidohydrolase
MRTSAEGTLPATAISLEQTAPSPEDRPGNVAEIHRRLDRAIQRGADIVVFPELAHSGYIVAPGVVAAAAETVDGPFVSGLVDRLRGTDTLVAAGMCEKEGNSYFNTVVVLGQDGVLLRYRKVHLFDEEQVAYTPGDQLPIVETRHGVLGVCVCYDL